MKIKLNSYRLLFRLLDTLSNSKWLHKRVIDQKIYLGATIISMSMLNSSCTSETKKTEEPKPENKNIDTNQLKTDSLKPNSEQRDTIDRSIRKINNKHKVLSDLEVSTKTPPIIEIVSCYAPIDLNRDNYIEDSATLAIPNETPRFIGGNSAMVKFISDQMKFPANAKKSETVYIEFLVTKTGELTNIAVKKGVNSAYNEEAIRIVKKMPKWIPGKSHGKKVDIRTFIPIRFELK